MYIEETLNGREELPEHDPNKLLSYYNYVAVLHKKKNYTEAKRVSNDVLTTRERTLDPNHPDTLSSKHQLGWLYLTVERLPDAEELFSKALHGRKSVLSVSHPHTLSSLFHYCLTCAKRTGHHQYREVFNKELGVQEAKTSISQIKQMVSGEILQ